jgi:hypothetical protein
MPIGNWNLQWLNHNSQRAYPLTERASKVDTSSVITIPDSFIVELYLPIHSGTTFTPAGFFIKSLLISPTGFNIVVGYSDGTNTVDVAATNIARSSFIANRAYALIGIDNFYDSVGYIVIGNLDEIDLLPSGLYTFTSASAELEPGAIRPMLRAVSRLQVINNTETSAPIYGDVTLVAGPNVRLNVITSGAETQIVFQAISGENLNQNCLCQIPDTADCITSINGQTGINGNFEIAPNDCIEIETIAGGIKISDICAQPCCGCSELNAVLSQIDRFGDGITTLQNFVTRLGSEVTQMSLVVLGSRLSSSGCDTTTG